MVSETEEIFYTVEINVSKDIFSVCQETRTFNT